MPADRFEEFPVHDQADEGAAIAQARVRPAGDAYQELHGLARRIFKRAEEAAEAGYPVPEIGVSCWCCGGTGIVRFWEERQLGHCVRAYRFVARCFCDRAGPRYQAQEIPTFLDLFGQWPAREEVRGGQVQEVLPLPKARTRFSTSAVVREWERTRIHD